MRVDFLWPNWGFEITNILFYTNIYTTCVSSCIYAYLYAFEKQTLKLFWLFDYVVTWTDEVLLYFIQSWKLWVFLNLEVSYSPRKTRSVIYKNLIMLNRLKTRIEFSLRFLALRRRRLIKGEQNCIT